MSRVSVHTKSHLIKYLGNRLLFVKTMQLTVLLLLLRVLTVSTDSWTYPSHTKGTHLTWKFFYTTQSYREDFPLGLHLSLVCWKKAITNRSKKTGRGRRWSRLLSSINRSKNHNNKFWGSLQQWAGRTNQRGNRFEQRARHSLRNAKERQCDYTRRSPRESTVSTRSFSRAFRFGGDARLGAHNRRCSVSRWGDRDAYTWGFNCSGLFQVHFVHYNTKYRDLESALMEENGLSVIGVFLKVNNCLWDSHTKTSYSLDLWAIPNSMNSNSRRLAPKVWCLSTSDLLTYSIPPLPPQGMKNSVGTLFLNNLLPTRRDYYTYEGSLTTPPCDENVRWIVMRHPIPITPSQVSRGTTLFNDWLSEFSCGLFVV